MEFSSGVTASILNIEILQRIQSKTLRSILNAPWFINHHGIHEHSEHSAQRDKSVEYLIYIVGGGIQAGSPRHVGH
jgi:hypothetical protein